MDSLLASYASSDDDADEAPPGAAPPPARGGAKAPVPSSSPFSTDSGSGGGGIFSKLPQPKSGPLFSALPAPKSAPAFSAIPPPKSSANPKRVVQYRPQPIRQPTDDSSEDDEDDAKKRRASAADARPAVPAGSGPVSSFLPPPKHSLGLGSGAGAGAGARRSSIDTAAPERSNIAPSGLATEIAGTGAPGRADEGAADDDESEDSGSEDDMPVPEELEEGNDEQPGFDTGAGHHQQQQGYGVGVGSTSGHEAYAWDPNYYAQYGASYGWDPSGNVNYSIEAQYAAYGAEHGGGYVHSQGEQYSGTYGQAVAPYGVDHSGGYGHEVAATKLPPEQAPVIPPEMGRIGGKRGRSDMPAEIVEVNQAELMKNRPVQDKSKLTGLAFGPSYQPAPSAKGKPSKMHKRKHQIGSLYFDMKSKEMELAERRSKGILTKAETQAKYGW